jgi:hypothetical protein
MTQAFDAMYEWSKRVVDERVEENDVTVIVGTGRSAREVTSHNCTVRGLRDGVTVVVTFYALYPCESRTGLTRPVLRDVLDVFLADGMTALECVVRRKTGWERLVSVFRRRPPPHPLFATCMIEAGAGERGRNILSQVPFLDALHDLMRQPRFVRLEFQAAAGVTALCRVDPGTLTADVIDSAVQWTADLLHGVSRAARAKPT